MQIQFIKELEPIIAINSILKINSLDKPEKYETGYFWFKLPEEIYNKYELSVEKTLLTVKLLDCLIEHEINGKNYECLDGLKWINLHQFKAFISQNYINENDYGPLSLYPLLN